MTLVLSWLARDSRKVSAAYIASDSRISWDLTTNSRGLEFAPIAWDSGRKLFVFRNYPDIVAYCGDVLFPTQLITQAIDIFDMRVNSSSIDFPERISQFTSLLKEQLNRYPTDLLGKFEILIAGRYLDAYQFGRYYLKWDSKVLIESYLSENALLFETAIILGSGKSSFEAFYVSRFSKSDMHNFSRAGFSALSDYLKWDGKEKHCGGATQLVSIFNQGQPKVIGTIFGNERYILGSRVDNFSITEGFDWRDELFQRIQPNKLALIENAQQHGLLKIKKS